MVDTVDINSFCSPLSVHPLPSQDLLIVFTADLYSDLGVTVI